MKINKVSIIGNGFVGNALHQNFRENTITYVYDISPERCLNTLDECFKADLIFVCLPTPMKSVEGGDCNLNILNKFFTDIPLNIEGIFVIKSTVPIGTTRSLQEFRKDLKILHNPEFLTAANAVEDFKNSERNVIGGNNVWAKQVEEFFKQILPSTPNILVSSDESEAIKYFSNTFLALKVAYFNQVFDLTQTLGLDYNSIVAGITADSRIGRSHTKTPGPDGDRGFGGTCFPKDINALIHTLKKLNLDVKLLESVWEYNKSIRTNWDWADSKSAVNND
jgi:UDPglucose 6-dehydrogenase